MTNVVSASGEDNSGPKDGPAVERIVPRTAVRQIAQECARAICDTWEVGKWSFAYVSDDFYYATVEEVAERLEHTLNAINETRQEARRPTS